MSLFFSLSFSFTDMNTLGMPSMGNHASTQIMPEKKMTPPDSKNPASNFASAFKNKVFQQVKTVCEKFMFFLMYYFHITFLCIISMSSS